MDPFGNEDIAWLHNQLSGHAHGLSGIYERISIAIQRLENEKAALQNRLKDLKRDDHPTSEARRLRDENANLRAMLAATTKEKAEVTHERDVLLRKLNSVKQVILDPTFDDRATSDAAGPGPSSPTTAAAVSNAVPPLRLRDPRALTATQRTVSAPDARTDISEPVTDVTVMLDTPGRGIRARPRTAPTGARAVSGPPAAAAAHCSSAPPGGGEPWPLPPLTTTQLPSPDTANSISSPLQGPSSVFALNVSPGIMSEDLSVQYEDASGANVSGAGPSKAGKKWKLHFAKPPSSAEAMAIKPVTTAVLVEKLELDEETRRSIDDLALLPPGSFRLYIHDAFGLAFLYDPILLESPEATYVVEWSEVTGARTTKTYITEAKEKHAELHTFIFAPRKKGWQYLGQQRWNLVDIKPIWHSLIDPAQRALASRRSQDAEMIAEITRGLKRGQLEQITVELVQVSVLGPNAAESAVKKKLHD